MLHATPLPPKGCMIYMLYRSKRVMYPYVSEYNKSIRILGGGQYSDTGYLYLGVSVYSIRIPPVSMHHTARKRVTTQALSGEVSHPAISAKNHARSEADV